MSGSLTDAYFEDDSEDGKTTVLLFEDPLRPGELKMEARLNPGPAVRVELDEKFATRLAFALNAWYAHSGRESDDWEPGYDEGNF
jgi:hypothetical protein